jgi:hypothetical protein
MAKTKLQPTPEVAEQAPADAYTPAALMAALRRGTMAEKIEVLKQAGIVDKRGKLTQRYTNWGKKITRTPDL